MDILERGLAAKNFAMLGLGDIVIPGKHRHRKIANKLLVHIHYFYNND